MAHFEEWRPAPGLPLYEVSNFGRVRNISGRLRKLKLCKRGYLHLSVSNGRGSSRNVSVARLVCEAFNGPPPEPGFDSDHKNRDRADNRADNLRWLTRDDNLAHRECPGGEQHWHARLTDQAVREIKKSAMSSTELAKRYGVHRRTVADVRLGNTWSHIDG